MHTTALIIETPSIQKYIFASNKLKENIGASHIIEHELYPICVPNNTNGKKVLVGGGKALFKFPDPVSAKKFLNEFSLNVLSYFPGIQINAAIDEYNEKHYAHCRRGLDRKLRLNRSLHPPHVLLPKDGVFVDCPQTNEYQEVNHSNVGAISNVSRVKLEACVRAQKKRNEKPIHNNFVFTDEIELLGHQKDKGYIAVVHIDGNNIGQRFIEVQSESDLVKLSDQVKSYGTGAMDLLLEDVIKDFTENGLDEEIELEAAEDGKSILPIRPILTAGDDITFVCEGRLGIYLAERFITHFEALANKDISEGEQRITACAGVAIVKVKFPFFKAYGLAEELCKEAKKKSRAKGDSWISFHSTAQGLPGGLKEIRKVELKSANGCLTSNPYCLDRQHENTLTTLKSMARDLYDNWPMNKIMELRDIVKQSSSSQKLFKKEIAYRNHTLPDDLLWKDKKTRYWDAICLLDFYPKCLLK